MSLKKYLRQRLEEIPLRHNNESLCYLTQQGIRNYCKTHSIDIFDEKGLAHIRNEFFSSQKHNGKYLSETLAFRVLGNRIKGIRINFAGYEHYVEEEDKREQEYTKKQEKEWLKQLEEEQERERKDKESEERIIIVY